MNRSTQFKKWNSAIRRRALATTAATATLAIGLITAAVATQPARTQPFAHAKWNQITLHDFSSVPDAQEPRAGLIRDPEGNLYGTTQVGGDNDLGAVFKVDTGGNETVLYSFSQGTDGGQPFARLVQDKQGNLYGTTVVGGIQSDCGAGCGVVFKVDPSGNETVQYSFTGQADGASPHAGLVRDAAGNMYGTTVDGGNTANCPNGGEGGWPGCGVVFKLDTSGHETVLHTFTGTDGANPYAELIRDKDGNLYGATFFGGDLSQCQGNYLDGGCGVIFKLDAQGKETVLYTFTGGSDGAFPQGPLVRDTYGNLYGTTAYGGNTGNCGGAVAGCGVVFKLDTSGAETVLYTFTGGGDGAAPDAGLVRNAKGDLFGTTRIGGNYADCMAIYYAGCGVVFEVDASGKEKTLYTFTGQTDGGNSDAPLLRGPHDILYGTTSYYGNNSCGNSGCGTVFELQK